LCAAIVYTDGFYNPLLNFAVNYWIMVKELEDYRWFPARLRRYQMDFIGNLVQWLQLYKPLVTVVQQLLRQQSLHQITDCCSGNGGPAIYVQGLLQPKPTTTLTDKYPQKIAATAGVHYLGSPTDVLQLMPKPDHLYTLYNSFHHFTTAEQQALLQRFAQARASCMIAEILEPNIFVFIKILLTTTIGQLLMAPFVKPFAWGRLLFTYLLPINILTVTYDGIVSVLKSKSVKTYSALIDNIRVPGYTFTVKRIGQLTGNIIYITGHPST
jgi:hypothetical protein